MCSPVPLIITSFKPDHFFCFAILTAVIVYVGIYYMVFIFC